jgi:hypothetical protein
LPAFKDITPFIPNKYYHWYMRLCAGWDCAKDRLEDYKERHHIVPRSIGGGNRKSNLDSLSFRKHFLAHWLLTKCTEGKARVQMLGALHRMIGSGEKQVISGWQFAIAKLANVKMNADPEVKAAAAGRLKALHADPEYAARHVARMKALHADPEFAAKRDDLSSQIASREKPASASNGCLQRIHERMAEPPTLDGRVPAGGRKA